MALTPKHPDLIAINDELIKAIKDSVNDIRLCSIKYFLIDLIERRTDDPAIEKYRITNTKTNTKITTLSALLSALDKNELSGGFNYAADRLTGDRVHPCFAVPLNIEVDIDTRFQEDSILAQYFGSGKKRLFFSVSYVSDGDAALPLKAFDVKLTGVVKE